ncbi:MAG: hypothetical protein ACM3X6_08980 [Patescibacteria group bacterium]
MTLRWLWWSLIAACLAAACIYLVGLAIGRLGQNRPSAKARLVRILTIDGNCRRPLG